MQCATRRAVQPARCDVLCALGTTVVGLAQLHKSACHTQLSWPCMAGTGCLLCVPRSEPKRQLLCVLYTEVKTGPGSTRTLAKLGLAAHLASAPQAQAAASAGS